MDKKVLLKKLFNTVKQIKISQLSLKWEKCHLCGWRVQIKTHNDEMGVRCTRCFATPVSQMMAKVFKQYQNNRAHSVYELSSRGAFVRFLKNRSFRLTLSEYFDGVNNGDIINGVLCQNVEELTFSDESFDICTSLEVFEHVENDDKGFKEILRVLKKGGVFIFTVPINLKVETIERTKVIQGKRQQILPAEYHSDSIRGANQVFCYRNYGCDIIQKLKKSGFEKCTIYQPPKSLLFGFGRPVIIAFKKILTQ